MELKIILGSIAALLALFSSYLYIRDIFRGNTKPHAYTWLIWSIVTTIAFLGQWVSGGGPGSWATGVAAIVTTGTFFYRSIKNMEQKTLLLSIRSVLPWQSFLFFPGF